MSVRTKSPPPAVAGTHAASGMKTQGLLRDDSES